MIKAKIHGTIRRTCPDCHLTKDLVVFSYSGKTGMYCDDCMIKHFGEGIVTNKKRLVINNEWCDSCESLSMECVSSKITNLFIKKKFRCKYCGRSVVRTVRKWRK